MGCLRRPKRLPEGTVEMDGSLRKGKGVLDRLRRDGDEVIWAHLRGGCGQICVPADKGPEKLPLVHGLRRPTMLEFVGPVRGQHDQRYATRIRLHEGR